MTDINGNNTETTFTTGLTTDTIQDLSDTAHITLTTDTIDLVATNVLVNGSSIGLPTVLPHNLDLGTYDITGPLGLSLTGINTKTQNLTALSANTTAQGKLTMNTTPVVLDNALILSSAPLLTPNTPDPLGSIGMRFTITAPISIFRIGIPKSHWTPGDIGTVIVRFYQEGNPVSYAVAGVQQSTSFGNYYVNNLSLVDRKVLPAGTYRMSCGYYFHMNRYAVANAPMTFSSSISNVEACSAPIDYAGYPTNVSVGLQMTFGGMFWFDDLGTTGTVLAPLIQADQVVINGGTSLQYLMADGTRLQFSANSGNSNYYLYKSGTSMDIIPADGYITYNNATQTLSTIIYISHLTRDNIDIEVYFKQISSLVEIYIQDQNLSEAFMQFNVTGTPTITVNNKVAIPVLISSAGVGITGFPNSHNVLLSFFTNTLETDTRLSTLETKTTNLETKTQYQSIVGLITSFTNGLRINGPVFLNGASILDVATINRPYYGLQYQHNSSGVPAVQSSSLITAFGSTALSAAPWVKTNNYTRQYGCGLWTTGGLADGAPCGYGGTVSTGAYVTMDLGSTFGLSYSLAIADSAYNANNCQNFFGLWWLQSVIPLNQTTQLNVQRNMLCFGSSTNDPNICIYSGGAATTVKWVDLGGYFPANIPASGALTNFFKFLLYWDGTTVYYRADNTSFPDSVADAHITGQFTPLASQIPTASCTNQCVRIMGTPQSNGQGRLKVQRFGVF